MSITRVFATFALGEAAATDNTDKVQFWSDWLDCDIAERGTSAGDGECNDPVSRACGLGW